MSNIGFIESCAKNIQDIFNAAITLPLQQMAKEEGVGLFLKEKSKII